MSHKRACDSDAPVPAAKAPCTETLTLFDWLPMDVINIIGTLCTIEHTPAMRVLDSRFAPYIAELVTPQAICAVLPAHNDALAFALCRAYAPCLSAEQRIALVQIIDTCTDKRNIRRRALLVTAILGHCWYGLVPDTIRDVVDLHARVQWAFNKPTALETCFDFGMFDVALDLPDAAYADSVHMLDACMSGRPDVPLHDLLPAVARRIIGHCGTPMQCLGTIFKRENESMLDHLLDTHPVLYGKVEFASARRAPIRNRMLARVVGALHPSGGQLIIDSLVTEWANGACDDAVLQAYERHRFSRAALCAELLTIGCCHGFRRYAAQLDDCSDDEIVNELLRPFRVRYYSVVRLVEEFPRFIPLLRHSDVLERTQGAELHGDSYKLLRKHGCPVDFVCLLAAVNEGTQRDFIDAVLADPELTDAHINAAATERVHRRQCVVFLMRTGRVYSTTLVRALTDGQPWARAINAYYHPA